MRRVDHNSIGGGVLIGIATTLAAFTAYVMVTTPLGAHGGPYVVMGAVMYVSIAVLLAVLGSRLIRSSRRERRSR